MRLGIDRRVERRAPNLPGGGRASPLDATLRTGLQQEPGIAQHLDCRQSRKHDPSGASGRGWLLLRVGVRDASVTSALPVVRCLIFPGIERKIVMQVKKHHLFDDNDKQVVFEETPNRGGAVRPLYLIIHYTAGHSWKSSVAWLKKPEAQASAHLVIGRDGTIIQMVPFNRKAWHAGKSSWGELDGLNSHSIGIELDNAGKLQRNGSNWTTWFGAAVPAEQVLEATHPQEDSPAGWQTFTPKQLDAASAVAAALHLEYAFLDVLGTCFSNAQLQIEGHGASVNWLGFELLGSTARNPGLG
jgi:N-acetylmuramoyl-L-alanine amidase